MLCVLLKNGFYHAMCSTDLHRGITKSGLDWKMEWKTEWKMEQKMEKLY